MNQAENIQTIKIEMRKMGIILRKLRLHAVLLLIILALEGCSGSDDCSDYACFTPPASFVFDLVDKESGKNIFSTEDYGPEQVEVWNMTEDKKEAFGFIKEDGLNWISIQTIGWKTEKVEYEIRLDGELIVELYVDVERLSANCCTFSKYNEVRIDTAEYEYDEDSDIFTIYLN